ncbi:related to inner mitochondrial membrane peptidase 2 [Sporisorium reilianum SRZ2]|uniref:Mitochondrial inner membrane protease subunit 2 n=1 Tax=Sporisorium reilianum (strain SRZ2) TaxID=999809 RepID=E6ZXW0_SPORE|nr:related to inner mitochondrial membrane peptidase 2 [Sporisorium reilianum SRZ2]
MLGSSSTVRLGVAARACVAPSVRAHCRFSSSTSSTPSTAASSSTDSPSTSASSSASGEGTSSSSASSSSKYPGFNADPHFRPQPQQRRRGPVARALFALGWIPVAAFITSHLYSLGNVTGGSMSPTFNGAYAEASAANARSDVVLLNRTIKYKHDELRPGDIVTLVSPLDPRLLLTKRIIALPGDTVRVWVPGSSGGTGRWTRIKVPPGHVWVEGDAAVDIVPGSLERVANAARTPTSLRNKSRDSREFGPVPMGLITSRIELILWPPARFGTPAPRPSVVPPSRAAQYPPSSTEDRSTQVNPSLARILDEMTQMAPKARSKAHPDDSVISPYVDWNDPNAKGYEDGEGMEASEKEAGDDERKRKHAWNHLSRGGRLGDDAD